jgi:acetoin utilization deacetylase AcuC-like enzyme
MAPGLYFRHESSLRHETGSHPENKARIPAIEAELERRAWLGWERREAPPAAVEQLELVHTRDHVDFIRTTVEDGGGWFDADTMASPGSWEAALHAAGGACAMVDALVGGEATTAFSAHRPPGHHCEVARPMGFCLFNNIAVAARHARRAHGLERVAIVDWDVHHGNGTNDIFHTASDVLFFSIHQSPLYPGSGPLRDVGSGTGEGYTVNLPVPPGAGDDIWLSQVDHVVLPVLRAFDPQLLLISAGFDAHRDDPLAECSLTAESFGLMARRLAGFARETGIPFGGLLEGGYDLGALALSVAATLEGFTDPGPQADAVERHEVTERAVQMHSRYWPI